MKNLQRRKSESNLKDKPTPLKMNRIEDPRRGSISDIVSSDSQYPDIYKLIDEVRFSAQRLSYKTAKIYNFITLLVLVQLIHGVLYEPNLYNSYAYLIHRDGPTWYKGRPNRLTDLIDESDWVADYLIECRKKNLDVTKCLTPSFYKKCIKYLIKYTQEIEKILMKKREYNCKKSDFLTSPECDFLMHVHKLGLYIKDRQVHNDRIKAKKTIKHLPIPDVDAKKNIMNFFNFK